MVEYYTAMRTNNLYEHGKYVESHKQEEQKKRGSKDCILYDYNYIKVKTIFM